MSAVTVIHENSPWVEPLRAAFERREVPYVEWFLDEGSVDLTALPPEGVYYNRMSASSHTRGHRYAAELTAATLAWLERHGRRVVNGSNALALEMSKVRQYEALAAHGIRVPRTIATVGRHAALQAAARFPAPFIIKHNRSGKGLGVRLMESPAALREYFEADYEEAPIDGVLLVQEYIASPEGCITRLEFVGGKFLYAVRVDATGGFELCPADACALPGSAPQRPGFTILDGYTHPLVRPLEAFLAQNAIEIAAVEYLTDAFGQTFVYDVNTNTNYNPEAEARAGVSAMDAIAAFLGDELAQNLRAAS